MRSRSSAPATKPTTTKPLDPFREPEPPPEPAPPPATLPPPPTSPAGESELESRVSADDARRRAREAQEAAAVGDMKATDLVLSGGFDRIVETIFTLKDAMSEYEEIESSLSLGKNKRASLATYGELLEALDAAEQMGTRAARLLANAKVRHANFEIDSKMIGGALRQSAVASLASKKDAMKAAGGTAKQITEADVEAELATHFTDEWRELSVRKEKAKRMVEVLESLAERTYERARDLRQMVARSRATLE